MLYKDGKRTRDFLGPSYFYFSLVFYILGALLIKQLFQALALVGYETIIANEALSTISDPARASGLMVNSSIAIQTPIRVKDS